MRWTDSGGRGAIGILMAAVSLWPATAAARSQPTPISPAPAAAISDDQVRALACLTTAIAYEAGYEPVEGQQAVAQVIVNRLRDPIFPKSICGVVFDGSRRKSGCQFSFVCDGSLRRRMSDRVMAAAHAVADAVLGGTVPDRVAGATHYHASYVSPYWAPSLVRITRIGAHIFYRMPGAVDVARVGAPLIASGEPLIAAMTAIDFAGRHEAKAAAPPTASAASAAFAPWGLTTPSR